MQLAENLYPNEYFWAIDPWQWAVDNKIKLVAGPFTRYGHEFQRRPMSVRPKVKVIMKSTQMTFTESEVLNVLCGMMYGYYPVGVYYLFPSKEEVSDFSKSRFNPLIKENPDTIGAYVQDTDSATLKRVSQAFLYFRSGRLSHDVRKEMKTSAALKSKPADHAVHDEYDEMDPKIDEFIDGRLAKSAIGTKTYLANPTLPDYMIDKKWQSSSQEYWHVKCRYCGKFTCLDDPENTVDNEFPKYIVEKAGKVIRMCSNKKCENPLDPRFGKWVAKKPGITDTLGFTIGHPSAYWINPQTLLDKWLDPDTDKANFIRLRLGRAYIEAENRLSIEQVLALCGDYGVRSSSPGPCFMGVDQGKDLHVVIGKKHPSRAGNLLHLGVYKDWDELDNLMRQFNVTRCVVDALPETRNARDFSKRFPDKVFLNYYNENQKGSYAWNEKDMIVQCNRTESLDASHNEIMNGLITIPKKCEITKEFALHLHNTAKKLEEDEQTGSKRYVYVKLGPDHFRHAYNYECMARQNSPNLMFKGRVRG